PFIDGLVVDYVREGLNQMFKFNNPKAQNVCGCVYEHNGAKLFVSLKAMPFIDGLVVDYVREGLNQMFKFNNPKAQNVCGCGESFGV
ncbi:iron-sulfur cluster biosynthesis family protein, partial [Shigella sp. FC1967]|uniref:iron-sulfur cluster biosynthesis family protein n=1 Tax=Shigella sp. FC1967 TaxID=1898041 RepID=UPI000B29CD4E